MARDNLRIVRANSTSSTGASSEAQSGVSNPADPSPEYDLELPEQYHQLITQLHQYPEYTNPEHRRISNELHAIQRQLATQACNAIQKLRIIHQLKLREVQRLQMTEAPFWVNWAKPVQQIDKQLEEAHGAVADAARRMANLRL